MENKNKTNEGGIIKSYINIQQLFPVMVVVLRGVGIKQHTSGTCQEYVIGSHYFSMLLF